MFKTKKHDDTVKKMECGHDEVFRTCLSGYRHKSWCSACFAEWASMKFPAEETGFSERRKNFEDGN